LRLAVEYEGDGVHTLNVGTGRSTSIMHMAQTLAALLGLAAEPQILRRYRVGDIRHCIADPAKARETLGFEAQYLLEDGLPALIAWSRRQSAADSVEQSLNELRAHGLVQ